MKKLLLLCAILIVCSCESDGDHVVLNVAVPETMSKSALRSGVQVSAPQPILNSGKIYAYQNYLFINDKNRGVHVIDNTNPELPIATFFLKIPLNEDISIKDDVLYADSGVDLVVFDISDLNAIQLMSRVEEVFDVYNAQFPDEDYEWIEYGGFNYDDEVIVNWKVEQRIYDRDKDPRRTLAFEDAFVNAAPPTTGVGGSLARFQIVENRLYTVGLSKLNVFSIENALQPNLLNENYVGWNIETMFYADDYLYLGGSNGMLIYSLENLDAPTFVSDFSHWEGCDPVVVKDDYAYLTLRGGNACGVQESVLEIIDVSDKTQPNLVKRVVLENPYGLGIKNDLLVVCDGKAGLKMFDRSNPIDPILVDKFPDVFAFDVIPLQNSLLMIGDGTLNQYKYTSDGSLSLLSSMVLN